MSSVGIICNSHNLPVTFATVNWWVLAAVVVLVGALALVAYWQLVVAEGAYLGQRVVTLLYDLFALRYDGVKQFDATYDALTLAHPVMRHLAATGQKDGRVLDVATGTGRLPAALFAQASFAAHVRAIDTSQKMLAVARQNLAHIDPSRLRLEAMDALDLHFDGAGFDVVTCLEALEFMPSAQTAISEMLRVLKPGGLLLLTNRVGGDVWKLPGRTMPTSRFAASLSALGLNSIEHEQ